MTHVADLATCDYMPLPDTQRLVAIGWLHPDYEFKRGTVDHEFVVALAGLLKNPWSPGTFMGRHDCEFCPHSWGPDQFRLADSNDFVDVGVNNLFVPGDGIVYVAPSLIIHYLDAHKYSPPLEFKRAVSACPEMRSMDYLKSLVANGPKGFASSGRTTWILRRGPVGTPSLFVQAANHWYNHTQFKPDWQPNGGVIKSSHCADEANHCGRQRNSIR